MTQRPAAEMDKQPEPVAEIKISNPPESVVQGSKTLSVKDVLSNGVMEPHQGTGIRSVKENTPDSGLLREELNAENLKKIWLEFASEIKNESSRISVQLSETIPEMPDGEQIIVRLSNTALKDEFDRRYKTLLTEYLHKRLVSDNVSLESRLENIEQSDTSFYTDEQKFDYLSEKNPALKDLRRNLNLDFE